MSLFKAYDIRGKIPAELNAEIIENITRAFAFYLDEQRQIKDTPLTVVVGRDNRSTSEEFTDRTINAFLESGVHVIDIGLASTPYFYFAAASQKADGGMMITASHNPPEYNGCKLVGPSARPIGADSGMPYIEQLYKEGKKLESPNRGSKKTVELLESYIEENIKLARLADAPLVPLTVAVDTGNGVSALMCKALFNVLPVRLVKLFFELDGTFPNHMPNPLEEKNTAALRQMVAQEHADIGIAMDADGDRCIFIDEKGETISSDLITALLASDILMHHPDEAVLYDVRSSWAVPETIRAHGGRPAATKVGHALIKNHMRREHAIFAGELSGHYYYRFADNTYYEAPLAVIVSILRILSHRKQPLSQIISSLRKYFATGEINFQTSDKPGKMEELEKHFHDAARIDKLDGITIEYADWWCNVRPSNTEDLLRLNLEAKTAEVRDEKLHLLKTIIEHP
ncbi:phosphomannomutase/phosphoglucomutase [Candidatus Uhrbacteria bacterium]|nr:phosphomannomutase/phosphoglucomutase [Candidatus Uhrbacteria bacterium]